MKRTFTTMAAIAALSLGLAACGDDDDTAREPVPPPAGTEAPPDPVAQIDTLTGRNTRVTLGSDFLETLEKLELASAAVGDATISGNNVVELPITGGSFTYYEPGTVRPFVQGLILHQGSGLSLKSADGTLVDLTDLELDPGASVLTARASIDGDEVMRNAPLFFLDGTTLEPLRTGADGAVAVLDGITVELKGEAAAMLNNAFDIDGLKEGMTVGTAKLTLDTGA